MAPLLASGWGDAVLGHPGPPRLTLCSALSASHSPFSFSVRSEQISVSYYSALLG